MAARATLIAEPFQFADRSGVFDKCLVADIASVLEVRHRIGHLLPKEREFAEIEPLALAGGWSLRLVRLWGERRA